MQTSFGFGFGSPTTMQPQKKIKITGQSQAFARGNSVSGKSREQIPQPTAKGIGSSGTDFVFNRFNSRGMSVLSPVSAAGGGGIPLMTPHNGGGQLKPIEQNKYNISFCTPIGSKNTGINLESS